MQNNVQWASYMEEKTDLLCMPQIGQCEPQESDCSSR